MAKIHLPPELRQKTIYLRDEIIVGRWLWSYGLFQSTVQAPHRTREVILKEERWAERANCSVSDNAYFVMSTLDSSGLIEQYENYEYDGWNVGSDSPISNWYLSDSKAKADEVYEYLLFFSRLIDT